MADERVIDKIRKMHAHAVSAGQIGSEQEAATFAEAVNKLLNKHRLSMSDIQFDDMRKSEPIGEERINWKEHGIETRRRRIRWIECLANIVAHAHSCQIMVTTGTSFITLIGRKQDREVAEYLIATLVRAAEQIADKEYVKYFYECKEMGDATRARGFRNAFLMGFAYRIGHRFKEEKRKMEAGSTALVRFDKAAADVQKYINELGAKQASELNNSVKNAEGIRRGVQTADDMDIHGNAVNAPEKRRRLK